MEIGGSQIEFGCPNCQFINTATLNDVVDGASLICVGCLKAIELVDGDGDTKRGLDEIDQAFNDLRKAF